MSCASGRCLLIVICCVQMIRSLLFIIIGLFPESLVAVIERLVFDLLGQQWTTVLFNFLQILFIIVAILATWHYKPKAVIAYAVWCIVWLGWNTFIICFYLEVGVLRRDGSVLNLGNGKVSWWLDHGIGCQRSINSSCSTDRAEHKGDRCACLIEFYYVEVIHSSLQCLLAITGFAAAFYVIYIFTEEDDSFDFIGGFSSLPHSTPTQTKPSHLQLQPVYVTAGAR